MLAGTIFSDFRVLILAIIQANRGKEHAKENKTAFPDPSFRCKYKKNFKANTFKFSKLETVE